MGWLLSSILGGIFIQEINELIINIIKNMKLKQYGLFMWMFDYRPIYLTTITNTQINLKLIKRTTPIYQFYQNE